MAQWACYLEDKDLSVSLACLVLGRKLKEGMISHQWTIARVVMKVFLKCRLEPEGYSSRCWVWADCVTPGVERGENGERQDLSPWSESALFTAVFNRPSTPFVYGWRLHCSCSRFWGVGALFPGKELHRWVKGKKSLPVDSAYFKTWARKWKELGSFRDKYAVIWPEFDWWLTYTMRILCMKIKASQL